MAQGADLLDQRQFTCLICLDLLEEPVTIPCGHSFCLGCIRGCWGQDDQTAVYSCPHCNETFTQKPDFRKSTILAEVVRKLKQAGLRAAPPDQSFAGPGDVACDVCSERKCKAIKSCMVCLASYCETHLKLHDTLNPGKRHKLTDASGNLQEKICSRHDKLLDIYCRTHQQCICYLCSMDEHSGHKTVSAAAERPEKQMQLEKKTSEFQKTILGREKYLMDLRQAVQSIKQSAQTAAEDSDKVFTEMIQSIEKRRSEVKQLIRDQEKAEVSRADKLQKQVEEEIAGLRRRAAELEQLSHTDDDVHFLQVCQSFCTPAGPEDFASITINTNVCFEVVMASVSSLKEELELILQRKLDEISESGVKEAHIIEPRTREDFLLYSCQLTLDPKTADKQLNLCEDNKMVTYLDDQRTPSSFQKNSSSCTTPASSSGRGFGFGTPSTFGATSSSSGGFGFGTPSAFGATSSSSGGFCFGTPSTFGATSSSSGGFGFGTPSTFGATSSSSGGFGFGTPSAFGATSSSSGLFGSSSVPSIPPTSKRHAQVLCGKCWPGCCYWEAEWKGSNGVYIAVSYGVCPDFGDSADCVMGGTVRSWSLFCSPSRCFFRHNTIITKIPRIPSSKVGIYLDYRAGMLSFYDVAGKMTLLRRVQTTFTQPLYPGFGVGLGSSVTLVDLK